LDISVVIAAAGFFSVNRFEKIPGKYLEAMLDVNVYQFTMM
jgi:short-subunit dehydrogenase